MKLNLPAVTAAFLTLAPGLPAQVVAEHSGAVDPVAEGFALETMGTPSVGAVTGDLGFDAWKVSGTGLARYQTGDLDPEIKADALARGWKITLFARVASAPDTRGLVTSNLENLGGRRFDINLGLDDAGDTFVRLNTNIITTPQLVGVGPTYTLTGAGAGDHLYELVYDPVSQTADLFVDGVERISDYAGHTNFVRPFGYYIGCYQDHTGHYNLGRFEVLPAAAVPSLPGLGFAVLAGALLTGGIVALRRRLPGSTEDLASHPS